ncbi:tetratricopeptide repeat protein [Amycolatopsis vancoresmycina]|uniref:Kinesin light chain 2 n=1 Tax=Amycolatopsis vancoresmycina DSM 44592 TaxID=1292037 RepID=R1HZN4_9PSEU|nr:tetratricopeptide repeat protein [Amycolatopsis vancoresmycina]EOD68945.1 Kinesin light chain 2 [Amycolatopsis vancoresmycina DSM 44592]
MSDQAHNAIGGSVDGNVVQARDIGSLTVRSGPETVVIHQHAPDPGWPRRFGVVPPLAHCYQRRAVLGEASPDERGFVLSGLGGVGKTQLAAEHAERRWAAGELDLLIWITAESRGAIQSGYAAAAGLTGQRSDDAGQDASRLLAWLAGTTVRWLVVLDDVATVADLRDLWPPATGTGQFVVTTRRRDAALGGRRRRLVGVELFTPTESMAYLTEKLAERPDLADGAAALAADLGHLPLALAQATAYLLDEGLTCAAYRTRLADRRRALADLLPEPDALPDDHRGPLPAAWSLSVERADQARPAGLARPLMELAALLDANGIPVAVLTAPPALAHLAGVTGHDVDAESVRSALHTLHRLSLATVDADVLRMHALVQRVVRERMPASHRTSVAVAAARALLDSWPAPKGGTPFEQTLRANGLALHANAAGELITTDAYPVLVQVGRSLGYSGLAAEAAAYFEDLLATATAALGDGHPATIAVLRHVARWRGGRGDAAGAVAAFDRVYRHLLGERGADHPDTLLARSNRARWRGDAGDAAGAVAELEAVLADLTRVFGPAHPHTLTTHRILARWRSEAGDPAGAVATLEALLPETARVFGPDDPNTLLARGDLARWRGEAGDAPNAAAEFTGLVADLSRALGPEHPYTLLAGYHRIAWSRAAGRLGDPKAELGALLTVMSRVLGPDHPYTRTAGHAFAQW